MAKISLAGFGRYIRESGEHCNWGGEYESRPPKIGEISQGYEFLGGDPKDKKCWRKVKKVLESSK